MKSLPWLKPVVFLLWVGISSTVDAEVTAVSESGFISEHKLHLNADPQTVYQALTAQVHLWWDADHSYGGQAAGFSIDAVAGGCFCEQFSGGSVEHMRVVHANEGELLVMHGGLGPLQTMAVHGAMSFSLGVDNKGTWLTYKYAVSGFVPGGLQALATPVDQVQLGQLRRLQKFVNSGQPLNPIK